MKVEKITEGGLSRIWQHTQDDNTFAIIGSQDKDTGEFHSKELYDWASANLSKYAKQAGYTKTMGRYTYRDKDDEEITAEEPSVIVHNIPLDEVKKFAFGSVKNGGINQESIVWKDKDFFGILYADGSSDEFTKDTKNMTFADVEKFGTRIANQMSHNKGKLFAFKFEQLASTKPVSWKNYKNQETAYETLFEMKLPESDKNDKAEELLDKVNEFIDDVYILRKTSIMTDGEYGKGNMVFKELRNNGYLDKLKELKVKLTEKGMIVEDAGIKESLSVKDKKGLRIETDNTEV